MKNLVLMTGFVLIVGLWLAIRAGSIGAFRPMHSSRSLVLDERIGDDALTDKLLEIAGLKRVEV